MKLSYQMHWRRKKQKDDSLSLGGEEVWIWSVSSSIILLQICACDLEDSWLQVLHSFYTQRSKL